MKNERARRDIKRNCAFHKDIGHTADICVALKDEIERLIRAGHFKEFVDDPQAVIGMNDLDNGARKNFTKC